MRNYSIFLMEHDVAKDYFGREMLLYNLFLDFHGTSSPYLDIVEKQVEYITREVPLFHVQQFLQKQLKDASGFSITKKGFEVKSLGQNGNSSALLKINKRYITVTSYGNFEAETTFFESLRKIDSCFFALDTDSNQYGWLNPIKQRKYV